MIVLITPYYTEPTVIRKQELDFCLSQNISNPLIGKIVLVCDDTVPESVQMPFEKVVMHRLGKRPTMADMFYRVAPNYVEEDDIVIVSNSDIYFDSSLMKLNLIHWEKEIALSLSRWDKTNGEWTVYPTWDSQDAWIFKGTIKGMFSEFYMGIPGCDNRITYEIDKAGYWVFNPAKEIIARHVHDSNVRTYIYNGIRKEPVAQPYKFLHPTDLSPLKLIKQNKILHIGLYSFFAERAIGTAISSLGEYKFLDWQNYCKDWVLIPGKVKEFEEEVLKGVAWADYVFMQIQTPDIISKDLAARMKNINPRSVIFNWTGDVREEVPKEMVSIAPYVTSLFTNDTDVKKMQEMGFKAEYLQIGFPEHLYTPKGHVKKNVPEIVFLANNYYKKEEDKHLFPNGKARQDMVMFLKETYGDRFGVYGNGWHGLEDGSFNHDPIAEATIYRSAKIAINYSHFDYERYSSDRILRSMGSGCFTITHKFPRIEEDYKVGEHLAVFESLEQLKTEIDYFLEHEQERNKIAKQGCEFVHKHCTWQKRLNKLFNGR